MRLIRYDWHAWQDGDYVIGEAWDLATQERIWMKKRSTSPDRIRWCHGQTWRWTLDHMQTEASEYSTHLNRIHLRSLPLVVTLT